MMFAWFNAKDEVEFGKFLAQFFMERLPLETATKKVKSMNRRQEVIGKMFAQIDRFKVGRKFNLYKKAKLGNAFAWTLKDANYDHDFVDQLTRELLFRF
jgi:hypothetical protein